MSSNPPEPFFETKRSAISAPAPLCYALTSTGAPAAPTRQPAAHHHQPRQLLAPTRQPAALTESRHGCYIARVQKIIEPPPLIGSADAAFQLDIPGSTLRLYVKNLSRQLSRSARRSKQRLFAPSDIAKLRELRRRLQNGEHMAAAVAGVAGVLETVQDEDEAAGFEAELVLLSPRRMAAQLAVIIREQRASAEQQAAELAEANRKLEIITEWLQLPAWRRVLTTPKLQKPVP